MKILFINHKSERCGVADYGRRLFDILKPHMDITASHEEQDGYDVILYNYHYATCQPRPMQAKQIALFHEAFMNFEFDKVVSIADIPRPLFNIPLALRSNEVPIISSFGFGFPDKGYDHICQMVKEQFSEAIVRLNIPFAEFGDSAGHLALQRVEECHQILKGSNIQLKVCHQFWSQIHMVRWLSESDINLFLYHPSHGRGISSTIDYALSARRPIGISESEMFRHLPRSLVAGDIKQLIAQGIEPLKQVYEDNSNEKLVDKIKEILD